MGLSAYSWIKWLKKQVGQNYNIPPGRFNLACTPVGLGLKWMKSTHRDRKRGWEWERVKERKRLRMSERENEIKKERKRERENNIEEEWKKEKDWERVKENEKAWNREWESVK